jgi:RNA polymerase sigma factor (TIGR02999 family)
MSRNRHELDEHLSVTLYDQMRALAERVMTGERADHTLQPTALVHEAYLRLAKAGSLSVQDEVHAKALAANALRRVLTDHARRRHARKRDASRLRLSSVVPIGPTERAVDWLALEETLERLAERSARQARIVELRFYGGLTVEETATELEVSVQTVYRDWDFARAWLNRELSHDEGRD